MTDEISTTKPEGGGGKPENFMSDGKLRCGAKTRSGTSCKGKAQANGRCRHHGGLSTGPRVEESRKRIADAQKRHSVSWREVEEVKGEFEVIPPRKRGRPTKYNPELCGRVRELGAEGKSQAQMAAHLGVAYSTFDAWKNDPNKPEFSEAIKDARDLARAWWEEMAQEHMFGNRQMNQTAFIFTMKNRFPDHYKDRKEIGVSGNVTVSTVSYEQLAKKA